MFGQRVDYMGSSGITSEDRLPTPRDYMVTCAKTKEEAIEFEQEEERKKYTLSNLIHDYFEILCGGHDTCFEHGSCCRDSDCCIGKLCKRNPGGSIFFYNTCQDDPAYRFRDEGEVRVLDIDIYMCALFILLITYSMIGVQHFQRP